MFYILRMHDAQDIAADAVVAQKFVASHRLIEGRVLTLRDTVAIVKLLRAIEAQADGKTFHGQKAAPSLIEESPICLDAIHDLSARRAMFALKPNDLAKIVQP